MYILNATGYIVAAHKIQVASKVLGTRRLDRRRKGRQGKGRPGHRASGRRRVPCTTAAGPWELQALEAKFKELENGSRPEEISRAQADLEVAQADLENAQVNLDRNQDLSSRGRSSQTDA